MRAAALLFALLASQAQAGWEWDDALTVNSVQGAAIFPHLESANRQGVAVSGGSVGVVWEDNRDGRPQCYLATKPADAEAFRAETRLSESDCYEPVLVPLEAGRFVAAWEEGGRVRARVLPGGTALQLSKQEAAQVTLAAAGDAVYAAWAEQAGRFHRIVVARLAVKDGTLAVESAQPVEAGNPSDEQGWPALAVAGDGGVTVAWEDRRHRHTVPMVSHSRDGRRFSAPARLSDRKSGSVDGLGAGTATSSPKASPSHSDSHTSGVPSRASSHTASIRPPPSPTTLACHCAMLSPKLSCTCRFLPKRRVPVSNAA